jgi:hypothetical protein
MVRQELQLGTLRSIQILGSLQNRKKTLELLRPFLLIKHNQRFQTQIAQAFEKMLIVSPFNVLKSH